MWNIFSFFWKRSIVSRVFPPKFFISQTWMWTSQIRKWKQCAEVILIKGKMNFSSFYHGLISTRCKKMCKQMNKRNEYYLAIDNLLDSNASACASAPILYPSQLGTVQIYATCMAWHGIAWWSYHFIPYVFTQSHMKSNSNSISAREHYKLVPKYANERKRVCSCVCICFDMRIALRIIGLFILAHFIVNILLALRVSLCQTHTQTRSNMKWNDDIAKSQHTNTSRLCFHDFNWMKIYFSFDTK